MIKLFKKILAVSFFLFVFLTLPNKSYSQENNSSKFFDTSVQTTYKVLENAKTIVSQNIVITNKEEYTYAPSYSITLSLDSISDISVRNSSGPLSFTVEETGNSKTVNIEFPERIVGKGKKNEFTFSYLSSDYAEKTGSIFRVNLPPIANINAFNSYTAYLSVPENLGKPFLTKPRVPYSESNGVYTFQKQSLENGVSMFFGSSQYYGFNLTYHLENKNLYPIETEITIPPDTSYQEVLLKSISPEPVSSYMDKDGNVLLKYRLGPKTAYDIKASVSIRLSDSPIQEQLTQNQRMEYLKPQKYWEVNDAKIKSLARELKSAENIYDYIVKSLSYDENKVGKENSRLGATGVLKNPLSAVCLEFTDLFVALSRAAGIPARAVEGFAYTRDDKDKPLSLFQDVLHAWPEYYDDSRKSWIYVDPTWGNTTKGTDFFHQLDFDHVAFTINGMDSTYPVPAGGYKNGKDTKDVIFEFSSPSDFERVKKIKVSANFSSFFQNNKIKGALKIQNDGNYIVKDYSVRLLVDNDQEVSVLLPASPPFGESNVTVFIPSSLTKPFHNIKIFDEENKLIFEKNIFVFPFSEYILIGGALIFGAATVFIIAFKTRRVSVQK